MPEDYEAPLLELEKRIEDLAGQPPAPGVERELERLRRELDAKRRQVFASLTPWQKTLVARHPARPYTLDYVNALFTEFTELHGDRRFADDPALVSGFALYKEKPVAVIGHQKGRDTRENIARNFGMPHPEGYRKALRLMQLAGKFGKPIITLIDTPGAYPGLAAEERGQAEAIARNLREMAGLPTPVICVVTGEGGSGGALALGVGNRVLMLENSIYSVISPEACSSILYRDASMAEKAADALKVTARDLLEMKVIDELIPEPAGGAHRDPPRTAESLGKALRKHLGQLVGMKPDKLIEDRYRKFRALDEVVEAQMRELSALPVDALVAARYEKFRRMGHLGGEFLETT